MTLYTPYWMQAAGGDTPVEYSAIEDRALGAAIWRSEGIIRHGPSGANALRVSQRAAGANFSVDVAPGFGVIEGDDVAGQGLYPVWSDAIENKTIPAPPGSGTRVHRVVAQINDKLHNGALPANTYTWTIDVLEDTGSGTPAIPASAIPLATVSVSAGQASVLDANISDSRINALTLLGRPPFGSADSARPANPVDGEFLRRSDKGTVEMAEGGAWRDIYLSGGGPAWTTYTPSLTAVTTNPSLGSSFVREGAWMRVGRMVTVRANIKMGTSGATSGSGVYRISVPVTAKTLTTGDHYGSSQTFDSSANNARDGICRIGASAGWTVVEFLTENTLWGSGGPFALANNDTMGFTITYEAAS